MLTNQDFIKTTTKPDLYSEPREGSRGDWGTMAFTVIVAAFLSMQVMVTMTFSHLYRLTSVLYLALIPLLCSG